MRIYKQDGVSLLELFFSIAVIVAILLFSLREFALYEWGKQAELIKASVNYLGEGLNEYYYLNCQNIVVDKNVYQNVVSLLQPQIRKLITNPWSDTKPAYTARVIAIPHTDKSGNAYQIYRLEITTPIEKKARVVQGLMGILGATTRTGNRLVWSWLPNQQVANVDSRLWIMKGELGVFNHYMDTVVNANSLPSLPKACPG